MGLAWLVVLWETLSAVGSQSSSPAKPAFLASVSPPGTDALPAGVVARERPGAGIVSRSGGRVSLVDGVVDSTLSACGGMTLRCILVSSEPMDFSGLAIPELPSLRWAGDSGREAGFES